MWQHFEGDNFSFYEKLIAGNGIAELESNFEEEDLPLKNEMEKIRYYKRFSENEGQENLKDVGELISKEKTEEAQRIIVKSCCSKLDYYISKLSDRASIADKYEFFINDMKILKDDIELKFAYLLPDLNTKKLSDSTTPKIQWLGKTNVLVTLIYDLWKGQDKGKGNAHTLPLIRADKQDLIQFLSDNFMDEKGEALKANTLSDYLNTSKPEKRAKKGTRIELE